MVGYLGQPLPLRVLLDDSPHGLERQSYAARELSTSVVSADGWGFSWYLPHDDEPCVYRSGLPIWADPNRLSLGRAISARCILSAVRSATDPLSHGIQNTQPFTFDSLSFLHNGYVLPFRGPLARELRESLGDAAHALLRGDTDSEQLFALIVDEWLASSEEDPAGRLEAALLGGAARLRVLAEKHSARVIIAALLSDGSRLAFLRTAFGEGEARAPSLYFSHGEGRLIVASEPLDGTSPYESVDEGRVAVFETMAELVIRKRSLWDGRGD
jgi:glutamine amidotransferase